MAIALKHGLAVVGLSLMTGCGIIETSPVSREPAPEPPRVTGEEADPCGAGRVQEMVGRHFDESMRASLRQASGAGSLRVMRPGEAHTLDYRAERLNVRLDDRGRITALDCG